MKKSIEERVVDYEEIRQTAQELYQSYGAVCCPAFGGELVHFTAAGFNHLVYPRPKKPRDPRAQILRFDMLSRGREIIERSSTFQEYDEEMRYVKVNRKGRHIEVPTIIKMWGFVAVIRRFRVKVVVRQQGNGKKEFLSVAPAWFTRQYRGVKLIQNSVGDGLANESDDEVLKNATAASDVL